MALPAPLATLADLMARWPECPDEARAQVLLGDASLLIRSLMGGRLDPSDEAQAALVAAVACACVRRAMEDAAARQQMGLPPSTQAAMTAGPYQQSWTAANPTGDLYLTKSEKRALGISGSLIGYVPAHVGWGEVADAHGEPDGGAARP